MAEVDDSNQPTDGIPEKHCILHADPGTSRKETVKAFKKTHGRKQSQLQTITGLIMVQLQNTVHYSIFQK